MEIGRSCLSHGGCVELAGYVRKDVAEVGENLADNKNRSRSSLVTSDAAFQEIRE